jgi:hypothetical protein
MASYLLRGLHGFAFFFIPDPIDIAVLEDDCNTLPESVADEVMDGGLCAWHFTVSVFVEFWPHLEHLL